MTSPALLETYRPALTGHCYRMLGSVLDAEDAVQDTMLRAWKSLDRFKEQSSLKTWLYRIATNVCLDTLSSTNRTRIRPVEVSETPSTVKPAWRCRCGVARRGSSRYRTGSRSPPTSAHPRGARDSQGEHPLAFVAALQYLPPRQRAVLLLTQVLNWSAAEDGRGLDMSVAAVNSALQRARATLDARNPAVVPRALSDEQPALVARYVEAFEAYDVETLTKLLHEEATLSMPPYEMWLQGHESIAEWLLSFGIGCRGSILVPVEACGGTPAFAQYRRMGEWPWALILLDVEGDRSWG